VADEHSKVRILLADEQPLFRDDVKLVLESQPDLKVVAEAQHGLQAVSAAEQHSPDVALIGASLPNCDGIRATYLIRERAPTCRVVILTEEEEEDTLLAAVEAGASGYLTKESPLAELIAAAHTVHRGETVVPSRMLGGLLGRLILRRREKEQALRRAARLSRREREVLALLAEGGDNGSIA